MWILLLLQKTSAASTQHNIYLLIPLFAYFNKTGLTNIHASRKQTDGLYECMQRQMKVNVCYVNMRMKFDEKSVEKLLWQAVVEALLKINQYYDVLQLQIV